MRFGVLGAVQVPSTGDGERAALFLGAAPRGLAIAGDRDVARTAEVARPPISAAAYGAAYDRGVALSREDALARLRDAA